MKVSRGIINERMDCFRKACEERGLKTTHQRLEIYRELAATMEHPDAEAIFNGVRERISTISLDTVYRNLKLLAAHGVISIVGMSHERLRFDANMEKHHHFVCVRCGVIRDFYSDFLGAVKPPDEANALGKPLEVSVEVKGVCAACEEGKEG